MPEDPEEDEVQNPLSDKPSLTRLIDWKNLLLGERGGLDEAQEREKKLYFQQFDQKGLENTQVVKTGSAPSDADSAVDTLVPVDIQVRVTPARANRAKYDKQAEKLARFGLALIKAWRKKKDPVRRVVNDMVLQRLGVIRVLLDTTRWEVDAPGGLSDAEDAESGDSERIAWEVRSRRKVPIIFERRDPRYVAFRDDDDGTMLVVVEHYPTTVLEAQTAFAEFDGADRAVGQNRDPNEVCWVSDIWYGPWRCILIDEQPIFDGDVIPHGYAEIPYRVAGFRELPFDELEERFRGMLTNTAELYPMESQVLGMQVEMLKWNAWRTFIGWTKDNRIISVIPGQYLEINKNAGEYLEMMQGEPVPPELLQTTAVFDSYIQRNGSPQGPGTGEGARSGQMIWAIQAIRAQKVESARQALLDLVTGALELATMIVEFKLKQPITLPLPGLDRDTGKPRGEVTIGPNDINGYWDGWDISFGKRLDPATLEQAKALMALATNNWMPLKTSWEMSGLAETPQQWEDDLYLQATDRLPFMLQLAGLERVNEYYGEESWQATVMKEQIQQATMAQQGGAPGSAPGQPGGGGGGMTPPSMIGPAMGANGASPQGISKARGHTSGSRLPSGSAAPAPPPGMG